MAAVVTLSAPTEWAVHSQLRQILFVGWLAAGMVVVPVALAVWFYIEGWSGTSILMLAFAAVGGLFSWVGYETRLRRHPAAEFIDSGHAGDGTASLVIPYSRPLFASYETVTTVLTGLCGASSLTSTEHAATYFFAAMALAFVSMPVLMLTGRFTRGWLALSPDGIYQRGWTFESYLRWDDIGSVWPRYSNGPSIVLVGDANATWARRHFTKLWRPDRLPNVKDDGRTVPVLVVQGRFLATDPTLVYHLIGYYFTHPTERTELGTDTAVHRARNAAFPEYTRRDH